MRRLTPAELKQNFGLASERRIELLERFTEWILAAQSTGWLMRVWIFGSFATTKLGPGDLDIVGLFAAEFDVSRLDYSIRHWFDHELCRELHEIDLYVLKEDTPTTLREMILETFGRDRNGVESMVEVLL